jgi:hypothetical protein
LAFKARATSLGRPGPACTCGCFGCAGVAAVEVPVVLVVPVVAVVSVPVAVVVWVAVDVAGAAALPPLSPAFVTKNVMASSNTPTKAMIAGRGRSIR